MNYELTSDAIQLGKKPTRIIGIAYQSFCI
jgi:hypothetical protein